MRAFKEHFEHWMSLDEFVIARVIKTWGSSPRPVGSCLIIDKELNMTGSVSGGCVEGAVLKEAKQMFEDGIGKRHLGKKLDYGVSDEDAWTVGLSCGGRISVFLYLVKGSMFKTLLFNKILNNQSFVWLSRLDESSDTTSTGGLIDQILPYKKEIEIREDDPRKDFFKKINTCIEERKSQIVEFDGAEYFAHIFPRKAQMLIIGAAHISADLIHLAKFYEFETIVIDPRSAFADKTNFPDPPEKILKSYPSEVLSDFELDQYTYAVILSHDPKIDDNALQILLKEEVAYIGALGSKKTHAKRIARLEAAGFTGDEISRIAAPIGLSINAKTPREIALSIIGQVIEVKNQKL